MDHTARLRCGQCAQEVNPVLRPQGSFPVEVLLWFCCGVPGLIYSIWRFITRQQTCPECGSTDLQTAPRRAHLGGVTQAPPVPPVLSAWCKRRSCGGRAPNTAPSALA